MFYTANIVIKHCDASKANILSVSKLQSSPSISELLVKIALSLALVIYRNLVFFSMPHFILIQTMFCQIMFLFPSLGSLFLFE